MSLPRSKPLPWVLLYLVPWLPEKAVVMVEGVARMLLCAFPLGNPEEIPMEEVRRAHRRYLEEYGQH